VASAVLHYLVQHEKKGRMLLNVNVPSVPLASVKGLDVTRLGEKLFGRH